MPELSVLVPARNEMWLARTVADVCAHMRGDTEVIVVLDGAFPLKGYELTQHPRVNVIYLPIPIGQRAATNYAAKISTAKYVMKLDAHCAVAEGFDVALMDAARELGPDCTQIPAQKNLKVYDQVCDSCGFRADQAPDLPACPKCKGPLRKDVVWTTRRLTTSWRLDHTLHFQYDGVGQRKQVGDICDVMTSLGACFFMERERFWYLEGLDVDHGSWGSFGAEIALKSWLSGGRHVVNKKTWFAHFFRVGGIGFPYPISGSDQEYARQYSRNLWMGNRWPKQTRPLSWLIEKFAPLAGWHEPVGADALAVVELAGVAFHTGVKHTASVPIARRSAPTKGIVYYSDCRGDEAILTAVREQIVRAAPGLVIAPVTLNQWVTWPVGARGEPLMLTGERGYLSMFRQILAGLEALDTDLAFLCEHDVLYHPSHFEAMPKPGTYLYNQHVYKVDAVTGRALHYRCSQTSGLCADRELLVEHYRKRVAHVEAHGYSRNNGFEPGTRKIKHGGFDDVPAETWMSASPNVDIRHGKNLTPSRWKKEDFRNQKYTEGWAEAANVPGWPPLAGRPFSAFLQDVVGVPV